MFRLHSRLKLRETNARTLNPLKVTQIKEGHERVHKDKGLSHLKIYIHKKSEAVLCHL